MLKGSYNEEESSASFAQALHEWRNSQTVKNSNSWVNRTDVIQNETSIGMVLEMYSFNFAIFNIRL